jgi:hypothetical protein
VVGSAYTRATEGVFGLTQEELAVQNSAPSLAGCDVEKDLEKGSDDDDPIEKPVNPARILTQRELLYQRIFFASVVFLLNAGCIIAIATGNSG